MTTTPEQRHTGEPADAGAGPAGIPGAGAAGTHPGIPAPAAAGAHPAIPASGSAGHAAGTHPIPATVGIPAPGAAGHAAESGAETGPAVYPEAAMTATSLPPRDLPRWVRWTVVPLLVLVPLGYVIISAQQSRVAGEDKQQEAAAKHLKWAVPSQLRRHIYQVPIPDGTVDDGYLETNSWDTSRLYVQFTTSAGGLDTFLAQVGTSRSALAPGQDAIAPARARTAGWRFAADRPWSGVSLHQVGDKPDHDIIVDLKDPDVPTVFVVSTINFQHGFGGG